VIVQLIDCKSGLLKMMRDKKGQNYSTQIEWLYYKMVHGMLHWEVNLTESDADDICS